MSAEQNRQAALKFLLGINKNGFDESVLADDFEFWSALTGKLTKEQLKGGIAQLAAQMKDLHKFTIVGTIAEGDRVAIECTGLGEMKDGRKYENKYHDLFVFKDGKIRVFQEHMDTKLAVDTFTG